MPRRFISELRAGDKVRMSKDSTRTVRSIEYCFTQRQNLHVEWTDSKLIACYSAHDSVECES